MKDRIPALFIVVLSAYLVALVAAKPAPEPEPAPLPIGVWSGEMSEREAYRVIITRGTDGVILASWLSPNGGATEYLGVWTRTKDGWQEVYCPPGRECGPWAWHWDGVMWQGTAQWELRKRKADF